LAIAKSDGRCEKLLKGVSRTDLWVVDDWGLYKLVHEKGHDLLAIVEDRHGLYATLLAGQLPVERWHEIIGEPTPADAILDRLV